MSIDMKSQVRAYADFLDSTLPVLEAEDAMVELIGDPPVQPVQERPIRPLEIRLNPLTPAPRWRGPRAATAAVIVLGLFIVGVAWLAGGSAEDNVIDQPAVTTIPTQTSLPTSTTIGDPTTSPTLVPTVPTPSPVVLGDLEGEQIMASVVNKMLTVSPLGDIEWRVIDLAAVSPPSGPFMTTPLGLAVLDNASGQLWLSDTGTDWRIVPWPVPGEITRIESIDGGYLLESLDDWPWPTRPRYHRQYWESVDFVTWSPYRLPDGVLPAVSGVGVTRRAERNQSATADGVSFTAWDRSFRIVWEEIMVLVNGEVPEPPPEVRNHWIFPRSIGGDLLEVASYYDHEGNAFDRVNPAEVLAQIELTVTGTSEDWVAELKDATTGEPVGSISGSLPGLSLSEIRSALINGRNERVYVVGSGDDTELVQPAWIDALVANRDQDTTMSPAELLRAKDGSLAENHEGVVLVAFDDTLLAHIRIGATGIAGDNQIWQSTDGRTWEYVGAAPWPNNAEIVANDIVVRDGVGMLWLVDGEENATWTILRSEDGVSWEPPRVPPPNPFNTSGPDGGLFPVDSGWMSGVDSLWVSSDGDVWEQVDTRGLLSLDANRDIPRADSVNSVGDWIYYETEQGFVIGKIQQ